jgi:hypothetical protein
MDRSALIFQAETKVLEMKILDRCSICFRGQSEVSNMSGHGNSTLTLEADAKMQDTRLHDSFVLWSMGRSDLTISITGSLTV